MRVAVLASRLDGAGMNIISQIPRGTLEEIEIIELDEEIVCAERAPDLLDPVPDLAIFASRHASRSGRPCLTAHFPGNFSEASHGGRAGRLSMAAPGQLKTAIGLIHEISDGERYELTVEATHHGPLTDVPCFFIEIGSSTREWDDPAAGKTIARAISGVVGALGVTCPVGIGFGGPHYSRGFTKLLLNTPYSLAHIVPKHNISGIDGEMLEYMFKRSQPRARAAILDWKGIRGSDRRGLIEMLDERGIEYLRLKHLLSDSKR